jgi:porin
MLYRVPGSDDKGLSAFVRAGGVPNDRNLINFYADGGFVYKGLIARRPNDKVGIAAAYARVGDNARGLDADTGLFGAIHHPSRRRGSQQRRKLAAERMGDCRAFGAEFLKFAV